MEAVIIEADAYKGLMSKIDDLIETSQKLMAQNRSLKEKLLLSSNEVAELTGYNEKTIKIKKHEIGFFTQGKQVFFKPADVQLWIDRNYIKPTLHRGFSR
jgi:translation elongation factor EF-1alpha